MATRDGKKAIASRLFQSLALGLFGAFGLLLSVAGTFGLASYAALGRMIALLASDAASAWCWEW